jgi:hypothetical protein
MRIIFASAAAVAALMTSVAPQIAFADTYTDVSFTGSISPGNANVQPPFSTAGFSGVPGDPITGSFVFDDNLVPGGGTGFTNVAIPTGFSVPSFNLTITAANSTTLNFNLANELSSAQGGLDAQVQYNNGQFNGFAYVSDFAFSGSEYQFSIQGGSISIFQLLNGAPTGSQLLSGFINIGDSALTDATSVAPIPTPLPSSFGLFCMGLAGAAFVWRRARKQECSADQGFALAI